jgi:uncharacterized protein YceK
MNASKCVRWNKTLVGLVLLVFLSGCSRVAMLERAYPDYQKYHYTNTFTDEQYTYMCKPGTTTKQTRKRSLAAHKFVTTELKAASTREVKAWLDQPSNTSMGAFRMIRALQKHGKRIGKEVKQKYNCFLLQTKDN